MRKLAMVLGICVLLVQAVGCTAAPSHRPSQWIGHWRDDYQVKSIEYSYSNFLWISPKYEVHLELK